MNKSIRCLLAILVAGLALTLALIGFSQPVQAEIPTGNLNNNILAYGLTTSGLYPTSQWMAEGNQVSAVFGHSAATAGDVNGDGYKDVIVGAYPYDVVSGTTVLTDAGRVYVYYGSLTGLSTTPDWIVEGDQAGDNLGGSIGTAGDVNGDGYDDVIIAACPYDVITGTTVLTDAGRVYIYYGSAAGLSTTPDWTADGDQEGGMFGSRVATAGNVNGDNYDDVIIGAYKYDHGHTDEGRVYVYHGSSSGPGATAAWTAESDQTNTYFGLRVGTAGDVNGDGYDEVIVAAPVYDNPTLNEGAIFVWDGSATGLGDNGTPVNADWLAESNNWGFNFGYGVSTAGDVNGDGYDDVIAGSNLYNLGGTIGQGAAFGWYGSATGLGPNGNFDNADWTVVGDQTNGYFGFTVANAGDVNGDGYDDALVGAYKYDHDQTDEGRGYLFLGSASGLNTTAAWTAEGDQASAYLGHSVATAGDVNGDGYDDAIVGAHGYDNGETDEGRAYVYHGDPPPEIVDQEPAPGATDVPVNANVVITFSETITTGAFAYTVDPDPGGWSAAWNTGNTVVTLSHANFAGETTYTVTVSAAHDMTGNPLVDAPVAWGFTTVAVPITGLSAVNDSPTTLGDATTLTATLTAGSNVAYTWAFGDGDAGSGAVVNHTYPAADIYTATVTATNSVGVVVAATTVTITQPYFYIYLPLVLCNFP